MSGVLTLPEAMLLGQIPPEFESEGTLFELVKSELKFKIKDRALELQSQITKSLNPEYDETEENLWHRAENMVILECREEISKIAYLLWEKECEENNTIIHGNDLQHWFQAEYEWLQSQDCRYLTKDNSMLGERPLKGGYKTVSNEDKDVIICNDTCISKEGIKSVSINFKNTDGSDSEAYYTEGEEREIAYFEQLDLSCEKYTNKIIITDENETEVLAVVDSPEELEKLLSDEDFQAQFIEKFGKCAQPLIHNGISI